MTTTPIDPTLHTLLWDAAAVFGYHTRNPAPELLEFRSGRAMQARQTLREIIRLRPDLRAEVRAAVNAGLRFWGE